MKHTLRVFYWSPNGTNDAAIYDEKGEEIEFLESAFYGINIEGDFKDFKTLGSRLLKAIAVSPVSDGSETMEVLEKYFGRRETYGPKKIREG